MLFGIGVNADDVGEAAGCSVEGTCLVVTEKGTGVVELGETFCVGNMLSFSGTKIICPGGESAYLKRANSSANLQPSRS